MNGIRWSPIKTHTTQKENKQSEGIQLSRQLIKLQTFTVINGSQHGVGARDFYLKMGWV
jgi:hypothetical protein